MALQIDTNIKNITRFLYLIINELNEYALAFCRLAEKDYSISPNEENVETDLYQNNALLDLFENSQYKEFKSLFENDILQSNEMRDMIHKIKLSWKGERHTIDDIYLNTTLSISSPTFMFALYDILFKFYIGTFSYYIIGLLNDIDDNNTDTIRKFMNEIVEEYNYRGILKKFIIEYTIQINDYITQKPENNSTYPTLSNLLTELCTKLHVLGIFIEIPQENEELIIFNNDYFTSIIQFIITVVRRVNKNFNDLQNMYNNLMLIPINVYF